MNGKVPTNHIEAAVALMQGVFINTPSDALDVCTALLITVLILDEDRERRNQHAAQWAEVAVRSVFAVKGARDAEGMSPEQRIEDFKRVLIKDLDAERTKYVEHLLFANAPLN